ncbi:MAG: S-adenosylmethionine decarboxylase [Rhodospirillaceae bacterium]|nr:S-adenosylmethionine decarboxylase [Rhodospirillaceae bacterium]|tara:strand:- start:274 stop:705 length:432 start_codon:yes stop_codon:yes gene_type:complete
MNFQNKRNIIQNIEDYDLNNIEKDNFWGMHLIVDMENCDKKLIQDKKNIYEFSKKLVNKIEMIPFGEPVIEYFATDNPKASGFSLIQLIETSNISAHFADNSQRVFLDVFSCKAFIPKKVVEVAKNYFLPGKIVSKLILRGIK